MLERKSISAYLQINSEKIAQFWIEHLKSIDLLIPFDIKLQLLVTFDGQKLANYAFTNEHQFLEDFYFSKEIIDWYQSLLSHSKQFIPMSLPQELKKDSNQNSKAFIRVLDSTPLCLIIIELHEKNIPVLTTHLTQLQALGHSLAHSWKTFTLGSLNTPQDPTALRLLNALSSEIRTPLNAIIGYSELLVDESPDSSTPHEVKAIKSAANSILHFTSDINEIYKLETNQINTIPEDFSIKSLLQDIHVAVKANFAKYAFPFELAIETDHLIKHQDPTLIRKILINLFRSILLDSEVQELNLSAEISEAHLPSDLIIAIHFKTKQAIKLQSLNIFDNQSDSMNYPFNSIGLSVAISYKLCKVLRGSLNLHHINQGEYQYILTLPQTPDSTISQERNLKQNIFIHASQSKVLHEFLATDYHLNIYKQENDLLKQLSHKNADIIYLDAKVSDFNMWRFLEEYHFQRLPISPVILFQEITTDQYQSLYLPFYLAKPLNFDWLLKLMKSFTSKPLQDPVLIVEDDEDLMFALNSFLKRHDYNTNTMNSASKALNAIENGQKYSLLILDVYLKECNGLELFQRVRALPEYKHTPILLITGHSIQKRQDELHPFLEQSLKHHTYSKQEMRKQLNYFLSSNENLL